MKSKSYGHPSAVLDDVLKVFLTMMLSFSSLLIVDSLMP
jgi:hypothetical protein